MATTLGNGNITFGDGTTLSTASMIQSIQRGTVSTSYGVYSGVVNISAVTTAKCMVILTGNANNSDTSPALVMNPFFTTFNSTTQFAWSGGLYTYNAFSWQVIEFK